MPPFVTRKRHSPPPPAPPAKRHATQATKAAKTAKSNLFEAVDDHHASKTDEKDAQDFLEGLKDDDSDLSDLGSDDFEDVPTVSGLRGAKDADLGDGAEEDEDEEMDWEDAIASEKHAHHTSGAADAELEDLSISLQEDGGVIAAKAIDKSGAKKGPSKRERAIRNGTHCIHVQALMWHNTLRNSWLNDKELHKILVDGLSEGVKKEIDRWREDMGMPVKGRQSINGARGKKNAKGKRKSAGKRDGRDWDITADRLERGAINMSRGDPLLRLLKILTAYWRKRFTVTAPGLRKQGYMPLKRLTEQMKAWKVNKRDTIDHGERIETIEELRALARKCEGSRDVGSQLFTALVRGLGIEARLVANLQPAGIGWGKVEEALPKKAVKSMAEKQPADSDSDDGAGSAKSARKKAPAKKTGKNTNPKKSPSTTTASRKPGRAAKPEVIDLDDDSAISSVPSDIDDDDASIIDITPDIPDKKRTKKYDRDLHFPAYWTEALSPVSKTYIPVDPIVLSTVASNAELLQTFEPRGKRADQAKQVMCYTIAHSSDGSAKDVTVRYLKKHQLPGRTKGYRMPVEKIKVYNRKGKVRRYEDYDWFKTVMSSYERPAFRRTAIDDLEESTDLKPFKPVDEKPKVEVESLQWYKQSAEYVLERHLRREEAILPDSKPVKTFAAGKGDKLSEEPVYSRSDVVNCKTAESWHKEGREIKLGEQPLKRVPFRAVTTMRKREIEDIERETGEKAMQGLFSKAQTDWIIPPPIEDGVIPRNAYGNMDVYTPSMVPKGAVHIPLRSTAKICKQLGIDYAEACTGFEFGKRMAIPVITGVVVALENEHAVIDAWEIQEEERKRKEDTKKQQTVLHLWRKFVMGMRIVERMQTEYAGSGDKTEAANPFVNRERQKKAAASTSAGTQEQDVKAEMEISDDDVNAGGGGFFLPGEDDDEEDEKVKLPDDDMEQGGGFIVDDAQSEGEEPAASKPGPMPTSLRALHAKQAQTEAASEGEDQDPSTSSAPTSKAPASRPRAGAKAKSTKKQPQRKSLTNSRRKKQATPSEEEQDQQTANSDLSDLSSADPDTDMKNDGPTPQNKMVTPTAKGTAKNTSRRSRKQASPVVNVTPRKSAGRRKGRKSAPASETKSKYFTHSEDSSDDSNSDGKPIEAPSSEEEVSEQEVVKPRKTTARTRAKR